MERTRYVRWFADLRSENVAQVGGKNASLGELYSALTTGGVKVPNGFALTAAAYRDALDKAGAWERLKTLLKDLGGTDVQRLAANAAQAREIVHAATGTEALRRPLIEAYGVLEKQYGAGVAVAVRSSATAEDLPTASFAGQHESFLNVHGPDELFEACRRCFASVFTDRAIVYRNDNGFDHLKIGLSVGVMKMVRSDHRRQRRRSSRSTRNPASATSCFVTGAYGLGENIVQGRVDPDEFHVHKPTFERGYRAVLRRSLGRKQQRADLRRGLGRPEHRQCRDAGRRPRALLHRRRRRPQTRRLRHPDRAALFRVAPGIRCPWTSNGRRTGWMASSTSCRPGRRPWSRRQLAQAFETYALKGSAEPVVTGRAIGERIASGPVRIIGSTRRPRRLPEPATCWWRRPRARTGSR